LICTIAFFEGATFPMLDGLLGIPGSHLTHKTGGETPLLTQGSYASVRHPMYRAAVLGGLCTLLIHPNAAQLLWVLMVGGTFIGFIPVEENRLIAARGDTYRDYQKQTLYRLFRGIW
jgi:protein-S-isoprenylcysteine O-methyltransferase Ste14